MPKMRPPEHERSAPHEEDAREERRSGTARAIECRVDGTPRNPTTVRMPPRDHGEQGR